MSNTRGVAEWTGLVLLCGAAALGCARAPARLEPPARQAVNEARGRCPTDLNQAQVALQRRSDGEAVLFWTLDDSQRTALHERVAAVGRALSVTHAAVARDGGLIRHAPLPVAELRETPSPSGYGLQLVIRAAGADRAAVHADIKDHLRMWAAGECPELRGMQLAARAGARVDR